MTEEEEIRRGREASHLTNHPLFADAIEAVSASYRRAWTKSKPDEVDVRERVFIALKLVEEIKQALTDHIQTGKMASLSNEIREEHERLLET